MKKPAEQTHPFIFLMMCAVVIWLIVTFFDSRIGVIIVGILGFAGSIVLIILLTKLGAYLNKETDNGDH